MLPGVVKEASHGTSAPTDTEDKTAESRWDMCSRRVGIRVR